MLPLSRSKYRSFEDIRSDLKAQTIEKLSFLGWIIGLKSNAWPSKKLHGKRFVENQLRSHIITVASSMVQQMMFEPVSSAGANGISTIFPNSTTQNLSVFQLFPETPLWFSVAVNAQQLNCVTEFRNKPINSSSLPSRRCLLFGFELHSPFTSFNRTQISRRWTANLSQLFAKCPRKEAKIQRARKRERQKNGKVHSKMFGSLFWITIWNRRSCDSFCSCSQFCGSISNKEQSTTATAFG